MEEVAVAVRGLIRVEVVLLGGGSSNGCVCVCANLNPVIPTARDAISSRQYLMSHLLDFWEGSCIILRSCRAPTNSKKK